MSPQCQFILLSLGLYILTGFWTYRTIFCNNAGESWFLQSKQHITAMKREIKRYMTAVKREMMSPQCQRMLLFLIGCILSGFGICVMMFGDTHVASYVGGILTGIGMVTNLIQLLFRLPLRLPRRNMIQESELVFPSLSPRKKEPATRKTHPPYIILSCPPKTAKSHA